MKVATAITVFNDATGMRASIVYSEIDENGKIISDNNREDKVIIDKTVKKTAQSLLDWADEQIGE